MSKCRVSREDWQRSNWNKSGPRGYSAYTFKFSDWTRTDTPLRVFYGTLTVAEAKAAKWGYDNGYGRADLQA